MSPLALPEPSRPLKRHADCSFIATFKYSWDISSVQKHKSLWYIPNFANGFGSLINPHNIKHLTNSRTFTHHTQAYNSSIFEWTAYISWHCYANWTEFLSMSYYNVLTMFMICIKLPLLQHWQDWKGAGLSNILGFQQNLYWPNFLQIIFCYFIANHLRMCIITFIFIIP